MPRKGSTTDRGYGHLHQKERSKWVPKVKAGGVKCWRCVENGVPPHQALIKPDEPWDLGHQDGTTGSRKPIWKGPEHIRCNRSTAARRRGNRTATPPAALAFFEPHQATPDQPDTLGA